MIKYIFFDNDGVLVDTERLYYKANFITFQKLGIELSKEMYVENFLKKSNGSWHLLTEKGFDESDISILRMERNQLYSKLLEEEAETIDGVEQVLKQLYEKISMGIVTSSRKDHFDIIHNRTDLIKYFNFFLTSDDYKNTKPDPEPYLKALEISGMNKEECIVIEDSERGLKSAVSAGLKCYIIPTDLTKYSNFSGAEKVLKNITEILDYI